MNRFKFYLLFAMAFMTMQVWAGEDHPNFEVDPNGSYHTNQPVTSLTPATGYVQFNFNYYNDRYNDSWCNGLSIKIDNEIIGTLNSFAWEDGFEKTRVGETVSNSTSECGKVTAEIIQKYKSGNDFYITVRLYFDHVAWNESRTILLETDWHPNHDSGKYHSCSFTTNSYWPYMRLGTCRCVGDRTMTYTGQTTEMDNDHYLMVYTSASEFPKWVEPTAQNSLCHEFIGKANETYTTTFNVASNYVPQDISVQYYLKNGDTRFYDYLTKRIITPYYFRPTSIKTTYDQWTKHVTLSWSYEGHDAYASKAGTWMILRVKDGEKTLLGTTSSFDERTYTDKRGDAQYDNTYSYEVYFLPTSWKAASVDKAASDLRAATNVTINRSYPIQLNVTGLDQSIKLEWDVNAIHTQGNHKFTIYRKRGDGAFESIKTISVTDLDQTHYEYEDASIPDARSAYSYYVETSNLMEKKFRSEEHTSSVTGFSRVLSVKATKGSYDNAVNVRWNAKQYGSTTTYFVLYRRVLGFEEEWTELYSTSGTAENYSYNDQTLSNGIFYEYKVMSYNIDTEVQERYGINEVTDNGFCSLTGTISGNITYGSGTAVKDVRINLEQVKDNSANDINQFYALCSNGLNGGIKWDISENNVKRWLNGKSWAVQMYVNPDPQCLTPAILDMDGLVISLGDYNHSDSTYAVYSNNRIMNGLRVHANEYTNITVSYDLSLVSVACVDKKGNYSAVAISAGSYDGFGSEASTIYVGASANATAINGFVGHIDEVRIFGGRTLSRSDILSLYDHTLNGNERGLIAYWPLDEGLENQNDAYDYSMTNSAFNENHAKIMSNHKMDSFVPEPSQLSLFAMTDSTGNYIIKGVHYTGAGTNYILRPVLGIHEFSPNTMTRYISATSNVYSGSSFTDVSSFPVSGVVYYSGTNYPVEDCNIYIDGVAASKDGALVQTGKDGRFEVDVPIGDHFITIKKNGHTFELEGRYPEQGTYSFNRALDNLTFYDNTTVMIAGRVDGGSVEYEKPLGFGSSVNNIGVAHVVLKTDYMINAEKKVEGLTTRLVPATAPKSYETGNSKTNSSAIAGYSADGIDTEAAKRITITTDAQTGEFTAMLPPLNYTVESVSITSNPSLDFGEYSQTLDASNVNVTYTDSLLNKGGEYDKFVYNAKFNLAYRSTPIFEVTDQNNDNGAFGEQQYIFFENDGSTQLVDLFTVGDDDQVTYKYNYPVFYQLGNYTLNFHGYELYENLDQFASVTSQKVPLQNVGVKITNQFSIANYFKQEDGTLATIAEDGLSLDSLGKGTYVFQAGAPALTGDYTRSLSISYDINGNTYSWAAPGFADGQLKGIVFGNIPMGSNFVTAGPSLITMILRDPPGSASSASWSQGTSHSVSYTHKYTNTAKGGWKVSTKFGVESAIAEGIPGCLVIIPSTSTADVDNNFTGSKTWADTDGWTTATTSKTTISTSSEKNYDGPVADIFVGRSTNTIIGRARDLALHKTASGLELNVEEIFTIGNEFTTDFAYTQREVEQHIIPQLIDLRNSMIRPMGSSKENNTDHYIYVSKVAEDDPHYGETNYYIPIEPTLTGDGICCDSVEWCNEQVGRWKQVMEDNEKAKVTAIKNSTKWLKGNSSFDSGTTIVSEEDSTHTSSTGEGGDWGIDEAFTVSTVLKIGGNGFNNSITAGYVHSDSKMTTTSDTQSTKVSYTLKETGGNDALTVDIYNAPDGYGPIFYTRAGQTSAVWEDQYLTKYYEAGTEIMARTMKIRVPKLYVENPVVNNVGVGNTALFNVKLANESETEHAGTFRLALDPSTNTAGAYVYVDGAPLSTGVNYFIRYNNPIEATIELKQTDMEVMDYKIALILCDVDQDGTNSFTANNDTAWIEAHFIPASSDISIATSTPVINTLNAEGIAELTLSDYNLNLKNLMHIALQYKAENDTEWKTAMVWSTNDNDHSSEQKLTDPTVTYRLDMSNSVMFPDQTYLFRAMTASNFGGEDIKNYSETISIVRDMSAPELITTPSPSNGVYTNETEVALTFNQDIRNELITKDDNVFLRGLLNNTSVTHSTSLRCDESNGARSTILSNTSSASNAVNLWLYWEQPGTVYSFGTHENKMAMRIEPDGTLSVIRGKNTYTSEEALPANKWLFLSINTEVNDMEETAKLSVDYATDNEQVSLISNMPVDIITTSSYVSVGYGFTGYVHDLTYWDYSRPFSVALSEKSTSKNKFDTHIMGYWPFDEGHGLVAHDKIYGYNMEVSNASNWHIADANYSLRLNAEQQAMINLSNCTSNDNTSYLLQMWFRADSNQGENAQIFSMNDGKMKLLIDANDGHLSISNFGEITKVSDVDMRDGAWHNISLIVKKSTNANTNVYIDGKNVTLFSALKTSNIMGLMLLGGNFNGYVDEIRIFKGDYNADAIAGNMYTRQNGSYVDIDAYYPFEKTELDAYNQPQMVFNLSDHSRNNAPDIQVYAGGALSGSSTEVPPLKAAPELKSVKFDLVTTERKIVINITEDPENIAGCTLYATVQGVKDHANNVANPVTWSFLVNQEFISWESKSVEYYINPEFCDIDMFDFKATIVNNTSERQDWTLVGVPSWLVSSEESGTLAPGEKRDIIFTPQNFLSNGAHTGFIYLVDKHGISQPFSYNITCLANEPLWIPDASGYKNSMNIFGKIKMGDDSFDINTQSMVAAFDRDGNVIGMARPAYDSRYNEYFVIMTIYGNEANSDEITFQYYDASSGIIHPSVAVSKSVTFAPNKVVGTIDNPFLWIPDSKISQEYKSNEIWSWISFNIIPDAAQSEIDSLFHQTRELAQQGLYDKYGYIDEIVNEDRFSRFNPQTFTWDGELKTIHTGTMYKVHGNDEGWGFTLIGEPAQDSQQMITINPNWNWLGANVSERLSLNTSFLSLNVREGDVVKSKHLISTFHDGDWVGNLSSIEPTLGYFYYSAGSSPEVFSYPTSGSVVIEEPKKEVKARIEGNEGNLKYSGHDYSLYTGTMTMTAAVELNGKRLGNIELAAFSNDGTIRGDKRSHDEDERHLIYMVIHGNDVTTLNFKVVINNGDETEEVDCEAEIQFEDGKSLGNSSEPYIFHLDATDIRSLSIKQQNGKTYLTNGVETRSPEKGIIIRNGKKIFVK